MHPAYLAGFMDGEACIQVSTRFNKSGVTTRTQIEIQIGQKIPDPLYAIQQTYGGHIRIRSKGKINQLYVLSWGKTSEMIAILTAIEPYVIGKRPKVLSTLELLKARGQRDSSSP